MKKNTIPEENFFAAFSDLIAEKGINEEAFIETLTGALASAYKREYDNGAEIVVDLNPETGVVEYRALRYVVEEVMDKDKQVIHSRSFLHQSQQLP